ncbi:MAG: ABC transporter permease [Planktomarina sp.]
MIKTPTRLAVVPTLTVAVLVVPILAGLAGTIAPAAGYFPSGGGKGLSWTPVAMFFDWPGWSQSIFLSVWVGVLSTLGALIAAMLVVAGWSGTRTFRALERLLSPLLSVPHAAAALGLAFLIVPSGWLSRIASPGITGWTQPPDLLTIQDPWGIALIAGLIAKELPFVLLMTLAALPQTDAPARARVTSALGYGRIKGWLIAVFPAVYAQIKLPVYVVLAYGMSVVDVAIILGPNTPPPLSVQVVRWMADPDLAMRMPAAVGALIQLALVIGALVAWRMGEHLIARLGQRWAHSGGRMARDGALRGIGLILGVVSAGAVMTALASLAVWSFAARWRFPNVLPDNFTLRTWERHGAEVSEVGILTLSLAIATAFAALILTIGCLEGEHRRNSPMKQSAVWLLYLPLIVPQVAFLPGLQHLALLTGLDRGLIPVFAVHLVFVLPYVFLSLAGPFRAWDTRLATLAAAMGKGPEAVLWRLRLPMLLGPLLVALAVGMAVSVGQYLPTLLIGGGRVSTLATEAVALAAGGDRRAIGVWGLVQTAAALVPFAVALLIPSIVYARRKGMRDG